MIKMLMSNLIGKGSYEFDSEKSEFGKTLASRFWFAHSTGHWAKHQAVPFRLNDKKDFSSIVISDSENELNASYKFSRKKWSWPFSHDYEKTSLFVLDDGSLCYNLPKKLCLAAGESPVILLKQEEIFRGVGKLCQGLLYDLLMWWYNHDKSVEERDERKFKEYSEFLDIVRCFYPDFEISGPAIRTDPNELMDTLSCKVDGQKSRIIYASKKLKEILSFAYFYVVYEDTLKRRSDVIDYSPKEPKVEQIIWDSDSPCPDLSCVKAKVLRFGKRF